MKMTRKNASGFSLLELMVVVAILGVLATVAVPRFNIFRARARQAEAKSNMGVIYTLQESYAIEHEKFYDGAAVGAALAINTKALSLGYRTVNVAPVCPANKLGFTLANCGQTRYSYFVTGGNEAEFTAIAHAHSDLTTRAGVDDKRIFPGCGGALATPAAHAWHTCSSVGTDPAFQSGDAWCLDEGRDLVNYRDIVEFCE